MKLSLNILKPQNRDTVTQQINFTDIDIEYWKKYTKLQYLKKYN